MVPSIFYCYRNKSIWSWSKILQQFYFLSSPRLHMKSDYSRTSLRRSLPCVLGCLSWNTFTSMFVYFLFCVMDPVMPLKYFKRICPSYYNAQRGRDREEKQKSTLKNCHQTTFLFSYFHLFVSDLPTKFSLIYIWVPPNSSS